jgi:subtilisin family serine protease
MAPIVREVSRTRSQRVVLLGLQLVAVACLSCRDDAILRPGFEVVEKGGAVQEPVSGCARIAVHVDLATSAVTVQDGETCGELVPERDSEPVFDPATRILRLPIVLRNATAGEVVAPVRVVFVADSIHRYRNGQLVPGSGSTRATNADSGDVAGRVAVWRFDTLLAASGEVQRIPPGGRSRRLWLEFTGPELWLRPGGADADTTLSVRLDATGIQMQVTEVPAVAPDSVPASVQDTANIVTDVRSPLPFSRDVVVVRFKTGASQAARSAAIQRVSGIVIGGLRGEASDGGYIIQLPPDPTNDRVFDAMSALESDTAVSSVSVYWFLIGGTSYLRPRDDSASGWSFQGWRLAADSAYIGAVRPTWALEAVNAPRAWGCSVGDQTTRVAVIDQGLRDTSFTDLEANRDVLANGNRSTETFLHGNQVAYTLAARGDNAVQMSGLMWRASLSLHDVSQRDSITGLLLMAGAGQNVFPLVDFRRFLDAMASAANHGVRVINISLANRSAVNLTLPPPVSLDTTNRRLMRYIVDDLAFRAPDRRPLFVVSTGNVAGRDAYYAFFPLLTDYLPDQVVVVVGANRAKMLPWTDSTSSRIHIAAPGDSVGTWGANGAQYASGTSFATALVSGAAGLLFAFDPTLTTAEVRDLLIRGAIQGADSAGGVPILDAYESLKLAAQRPGAPLCGNRLWGDSGFVVAERLTPTGVVDDVLSVVPANGAPTFLAAIHGGKRLFNGGFGAPWVEMRWQPQTKWAVTTPGPVSDTAIAGTFWSTQALDHEATTRLLAAQVPPPAGAPPPQLAQYDFQIWRFPASPTFVVSHASTRTGIDSSAAVCVRTLSSGACGVFQYPFYQSRLTHALSPDGSRGFFAVTELRSHVQATGPTIACGSNLDETCTGFERVLEPTRPTEVYEIDLATSTATQRWTVPGYVVRMGISEKEDELVASEGVQRYRERYEWFVHPDTTTELVPTGAGFDVNTCAIVFRDVRRGTPTWGAVRRQVAVRPSAACGLLAGSHEGIGGIAPAIRAGWPPPL